MDLATGQVFGRYTIERVLGEGGMGRVYRASDTKLLRRVALKVLHSADDADGAALILREARAAAAITHENAVTIFDVGEVDGAPYIAMEYIQGETLRAYVGDASISIERRIEWLVAIARALGAAHERGLVHRDVKPENVIVREDGFIKVLDFGIAQHRSTIGSLSKVEAAALAETLPGDVSLSTETSISGTPAYMAPEQLRGERSDGRADQFAWGLVAYELLTGQHPCPQDNLAAIIAALIGRVPASPQTLEPRLADHVDQVVMRALAKDPAERFATMIELVTALTLTEARPSAPRSTPSRAPSALENARTESATAVVVPRATAARRRKARALALIGGITIAAAVGFALRHRGATAPASDAPVTPSGAPTAVTDLPIPSTATAEARAAYRAGLQSARNGAGSEARVHFSRAVELDPTLASAHVWVAALFAFQNRARARVALEQANAQRAALTERDARFLAAVAPLLDRDPADLAAAEIKAAEASKLFPGDAHLRLQLAVTRAARGDVAALDDADAALKLDPHYVAARLIRALTLESLGKEGDALTTYEACVADDLSSASCFAGELKLLARKGECERVNEEARRWTTSHPSDPEAFRQRAVFLSSKEGATDNVVELLATSRSLLPASARPQREQRDALMTQLMAGDLVRARSSAEQLAAAATDIAEHGEAALALVEIEEEMDRVDDAGRVAFDFFRRHELWAGAARMEQDPTAFLAWKAQRAKLVTALDAIKAREAWLERWSTRGRSGERWLMAYASGVDTAEEAKQALAALSRFAPLPALPEGRYSAELGHTYLLAGMVDEAIPVLTRAANDCGVLRMPIVHARSLLWLGDALALRGDQRQACDAYRRVGAMWSTSTTVKPVTASLALLAVKKLGCSR